MAAVDDDDEDYFLPLEDQRVFGAGISRKRVQFVRSSDHELNTTRTSSAPTPSTLTGPSIANRYLSIVLSKNQNQSTESTAPTPTPETNTTHSAPPSPSSQPRHPPTARCEVCQLPLAEDADLSSTSTDTQTKSHEASIAHQVCLAHSHPPSHLDRTRHGLRYLSAYGWDPDSRRGLGAPGREGIREPLKGKLKVDTVGLGAEGDPEEKDKRPKTKGRAAQGKIEKLNAKQVRKGHADAKKRGDRLREMFYQNDDVQKYLSGGG
ncbi:hypothetical protein P170DRAFT_436673 [Aspergillus steynii IBT 23096]|uniref:G-patch domain-containing protein n=1 Tax=Aspergillus steynii IBT 23096 TaxID=1392250 RepID=A0A2I2G807_9EURO|nr:uncharacterized protein P170DRAFT_436673 [Aspergillus steynii IBT 23096]PLB49004.1 hypothetical protein P170DRAFT_436673 [Aspergillus steynii IBT 23096]